MQFIEVDADAYADDAPTFTLPSHIPGDPTIDPRKVMLVNYSDAYTHFTVANGSDDQLAGQLKSSLATIAEIGKNNTGDLAFEPYEDGLAPGSAHLALSKRDRRGFVLGESGAYSADYSNLKAAERRVRAIRAEQTRRAKAREEAARQAVGNERAKYEAVLAQAPAEYKQLVEGIRKDADALDAVDALAEAIEVSVAHVGTSKRLNGLAGRIHEASTKLGVEAPQLPKLPENARIEAAKRLYDALLRCGMKGGNGIG